MPRTHKSLPRLYVERRLRAGRQSSTLGRDQTNYLLTVLRMKAGDAVDPLQRPRRRLAAPRSPMPHRKGATLELVGADRAPDAAVRPLVRLCPLKTGRLDYVVQKATEMGAGTIQPVITRFTQVTGSSPTSCAPTSSRPPSSAKC